MILYAILSIKTFFITSNLFKILFFMIIFFFKLKKWHLQFKKRKIYKWFKSV